MDWCVILHIRSTGHARPHKVISAVDCVFVEQNIWLRVLFRDKAAAPRDLHVRAEPGRTVGNPNWHNLGGY